MITSRIVTKGNVVRLKTTAKRQLWMWHFYVLGSHLRDQYIVSTKDLKSVYTFQTSNMEKLIFSQQAHDEQFKKTLKLPSLLFHISTYVERRKWAKVGNQSNRPWNLDIISSWTTLRRGILVELDSRVTCAGLCIFASTWAEHHVFGKTLQNQP